jgi:hypothetical protein
MFTLPATQEQFTPIDGSRYSMDEARDHFSPLFQALYGIVGGDRKRGPETTRERLFALRTAMGGNVRFSGNIGDTTSTEEEKDQKELACLEYTILTSQGLVL